MVTLSTPEKRSSHDATAKLDMLHNPQKFPEKSQGEEKLSLSRPGIGHVLRKPQGHAM